MNPRARKGARQAGLAAKAARSFQSRWQAGRCYHPGMRDSFHGRYRFGPFELDATERVLEKSGEEVTLQDLPFRLLAVLVERAPALVSRDELRQALWPPGTHLDLDASLNTAVARVRDALGDEPGQPRFVATVPRRGYKLIVPVERVEARSPPNRRWLAAATLALIAIGLAVWLGLRSSRVPEPSAGLPAAESAHGRDAAREHLLIARHHVERRSRDGLEKAIASFQSALAVEPTSSEAYSGLAASYALLGIYDFWRPRESFGPAETMARRALELDPASGEAHMARGLVAAVAHWDWDGAGRETERAVELAPDSPEVWAWRGAFLAACGRHDQAITSTEQALALDPTSPAINTMLAWRLFQARRGDDAITQAHRAIELAPDYYDAWDNLKWIQLTLGHEAPAVEAWIRADQLDFKDGDGVAHLYHERGLEGLHRASIEAQLERRQSGRYHSPYDLVLEYATLGEVATAMEWLERSFAERETDMVDLAVDPRLDALRGEARFGEIREAIGIPGRSWVRLGDTY